MIGIQNPVKTFTIIVLITGFFLASAFFLTSQEGVSRAHSGGSISIEKLMKFQLKTPNDRTERVSYIEKDGAKEFQLSLDEIRWEYAKGKFVHAWAYNGQVPGPEIRVTEGDKIRVVVKNNLPVSTSVHWHGIHVENKADGVPGLTQNAIRPGETFVYEFTAKNAGTHFYHAHGNSRHTSVVVQMDMGLTGAFIIEPKDSKDIRHPANYDREYVYMLDEWAVTPDGLNQALELVGEHGDHQHGAGESHTYTIFTINGRIFPDADPLMIKEGERIIVRLINAGTQEVHPMHTHGHSFKVIAIDGYAVPEIAQQTRDTLTVNPGERYDIEIVGDNPGVWLFHCHHVHHASAGMIIPFFYEGYKPLV